MDTSNTSAQSKLSRLAINEEGFVFDPQTGESFTVNTSGGVVIKLLAKGMTNDEAATELADTYDIKLNEAHSDVRDFVDQLRFTGLITI